MDWQAFIGSFGAALQPRESRIVAAVNHFTIRCSPAQLPALADFYRRVLGLHAGPRPAMDFPGHWLYAGGFPIVHLAATATDAQAGNGSGRIDHIALTGRDIEATRVHLRAERVPFTEAPISGWPLRQLFVQDPAGVKVELTFFLPLDNEDNP